MTVTKQIVKIYLHGLTILTNGILFNFKLKLINICLLMLPQHRYWFMKKENLLLAHYMYIWSYTVYVVRVCS